MYELVKTRAQQKAFEKTWEYFCEKYHWINDPYAKNGVRYNLLKGRGGIIHRKKVIGTIEFIPYQRDNPNSTVEGPKRCEFSKFEDVLANQDRTWEIDKLSIHENEQGKGYFQEFMHVFHNHVMTYNPKYYLALIEEKLYQKLRQTYRLKVEQRGEIIPGKNTAFRPILFDVESLLLDANKVKQLLKGHPSSPKSHATH